MGVPGIKRYLRRPFQFIFSFCMHGQRWVTFLVVCPLFVQIGMGDFLVAVCPTHTPVSSQGRVGLIRLQPGIPGHLQRTGLNSRGDWRHLFLIRLVLFKYAYRPRQAQAGPSPTSVT